MAQSGRARAINQREKKTIRNLQYGPRTRLVRGIDLKVCGRVWILKKRVSGTGLEVGLNVRDLGLRKGKNFRYWSEIGSGFGELCRISPPPPPPYPPTPRINTPGDFIRRSRRIWSPALQFSPPIGADTLGDFSRRSRRCGTLTLFPDSIEGRFEKSCDKIAQPDWLTLLANLIADIWHARYRRFSRSAYKIVYY